MPTPAEDVLLEQIKEVEAEKVTARSRVAQLKRDLLNAETDLISCKLKHENLNEELRMLRASIVDRSLTDREKDIERFKLIHPELLKKI